MLFTTIKHVSIVNSYDVTLPTGKGSNSNQPLDGSGTETKPAIGEMRERPNRAFDLRR